MDALLELLGVLALLHVAFGLHWFRRSAFAFRAWAGERVVAIAGSQPWGSDRMALLAGPPLPGTGALFLVETFPLSLGRDALYSHVAQEPNPGGRTPQVARLARWEELGPVSADGRRVNAGGRRLVETSSAASARSIARFLERLRALGPEAREREIESALERSLDVEAARARVAMLRREASVLRWPAVATAALLFGALPAVGATVGLAYAWPWLLGGLVTVQVWSTWTFVRAHRRLNPLEHGERVARACSVALSPLEALRGTESLSRDLLAGFQPIAAAAALLERTELEAFAGRVLRDAYHPMLPVCPSADPLAIATEREARERLVRGLDALARKLGLPADLATREPAADAEERSYCPRCTRTYLLEAGTCAECWDLPLVPFEPRTRGAGRIVDEVRSS